MRMVMNQYADGDTFAFETTNDGSVVLSEMLGHRKAGGRLAAYTTFACDDTPQGLDRLQEGLEWLLEEVRRRQNQPASV